MDEERTLRRSAGVNIKTGRGSITAELISFSLPLILSGILQQLYNWADAFVVGNVEGELALAAVGSTTSIINFFLSLITGFTLGLNILFAHRSGSGETAGIHRILRSFAVLLGVVFLIAASMAAYFAPQILTLMDTAPDTFDMAVDYLTIVLFGLPFLGVYNVYSAAIRGMGDSRAPFLSVLISSCVNVGLDILLVAVVHWSVAGAAIATVVSQAAMAVFIVAYGDRKYDVLRFGFKDGIINKDALKDGVRLGFPPMVQSGVTAFGNMVLQNFMNGFGSQTVAAITTAYRVDSIVLLPIINLGAGISTLVARSHGSGDMGRAGRILKVGAVLMALVSVLMTVLVIPFGGSIISLFGAGAEAVEIGSEFFKRFASFYIVYGMAMAIRGYLEGLGDVLFSSMAGISALALRILLSYTTVSVFGTMVIAYSEGFSWILLLVLYVSRFLWKRKKIKEHP